MFDSTTILHRTIQANNHLVYELIQEYINLVQIDPMNNIQT